MRSFSISIALVLLVPIALWSQESPERTHSITTDDYATLAAITEAVIAPDGKHVIYSEARWDKAEDSRKADLWIVPCDGSTKPLRLTGDRANDRHVKWAADGKTAWETAQLLGVSERAIRLYTENAMNKLRAKTKTQAVAIAVRNDILH